MKYNASLTYLHVLKHNASIIILELFTIIIATIYILTTTTSCLGTTFLADYFVGNSCEGCGNAEQSQGIIPTRTPIKQLSEGTY